MSTDLTVVEGTALEPLEDLANEANREHAACEAAYGSALEHAYRSGQALTRVKEQLQHGAWLPWLEDHFEGSQPTASRYMTLATADYSRVNTLAAGGASITEALKELRPPKPEAEPVESTAGSRDLKEQVQRIEMLVRELHKLQPVVDAVDPDIARQAIGEERDEWAQQLREFRTGLSRVIGACE